MTPKPTTKKGNILCNHDIENGSLRSLIKIPMQFMNEEEKKKAMFEPDCMCIVCGEKMFADFNSMKGVSCKRNTR